MRNFSNSYKKFVLGLDEINDAALNYTSEFVNEIDRSYSNEIVNAAKYILSLKNKRTIVMISGPSASGKTTTAVMIKNKLKQLGAEASIISLDNFYKDRDKCREFEEGVIDYESPEALDINEFQRCMKKLLAEGHCDIPEFNFITKKSELEKIHIELKENQIAIIEGIHGLNPVFTKEIPKENIVRIYVSVKQGINDYKGQIITSRDIRLVRRLVRDYDKRKSDPQNTMIMWKDVCKGQDTFIYPFKRTSDITINSLHLYELGVMKNNAILLLKQIKENSPMFEKSLILSSILERFKSINMKMIPKDSLIREFIGGGIY